MSSAGDPYRRTLIILSAVAALAILSSTMSKNPALPLLAEDLGASDSLIGLISAISPIPGILISAFAGAYSDRWGRQRIITFSLLIFATAPFMYLFVTEPWQLIPVRFYHGFATAMFMPVAMAAVADRYPKETRGEKMALYSSATMAGRFVAPFLGGTLLYMANFGSVYIVCAATGLLALGMSLIIPWGDGGAEPKARGHGKGTIASLMGVVRDRRIMVTSSAEGLQYYAMGAFEAFVPIYALSLGFNGLEIGAIMGIQVVSMLVSKPLMGKFSDRRGREPGIVVGLLVGAFAIVAMAQVEDLYLLAGVSVLFGVSVASVTASTSALVSELAGTSAHGSAIGVLSSVMDIGHSAGPLMTGIVVGLVSFQLGFGIAGVLLLVGALLFAALVWKGPAHAAPARP